MDKYPPLIPDAFYHIYNHAIGDEQIFRNRQQYAFFTGRMKQHLPPVFDVWAYSLLPNHFHLFVKTISENEIIGELERKKGVAYDEQKHDLSRFIMTRLGNCLNSYTKSVNKQQIRMGGMFMDHTKRTEVVGQNSMMNVVLYVHKNAVHHGFTRKIGEWPHDSYNEIAGDAPTWLCRAELLKLFGSVKEFVQVHQNLKIERK